MMLLSSCKKNAPAPSNSADSSLIHVAANDPKIIYSGRFDFSDPTAPACWYPGSSIMAKFYGTSIDIGLFDLSTGTEDRANYYNILIDDKLYTVIRGNPYDSIYTIARNLSNEFHTIEIFKRTEALFGGAIFRGFYIQKNTVLFHHDKINSRKIEFIGDSYTCGYGDVVSIPAPPEGDPSTGFHSYNEDNYITWGAITSRDLKAEYHCIAFSGIGMYMNNNQSTSGTLPKIYNRSSPENASLTWDTHKFVPDVTVINLGTNDFAQERANPPHMVDSAAFVSTYINFVKKLRIYYPASKIICVVPNSVRDDYPQGYQMLTRMKSYIQAVVDNLSADQNVFYFELTTQTPPYGEDFHPSAATHQSMADQIEPFIKEKAGWE